MQTYFVYKGVRGYHRLMSIAEYVNHPQKEEIERRVKIIEFFKKHGAEATQEAFGAARSTVYLWIQRLREGDGKLVALAPKSRAPKRRRKREVSREVVGLILRYRTEHPGVGKATIKPLLDEFCKNNGLRTVSESTVGRVLSDLRQQGKIPLKRGYTLHAGRGRLVERLSKPSRPRLRRKDYRPSRPGDLVQLDAIYLFDNGVKRYILSAIDLTTRFAFALCYKTLSSLSAKDLLGNFLSLAPFEVRHVQTDNGSEFEDHFRKAAEELGIVHFFNYPRHPQSNAYVERFHRTLREQCLDWCEEDPADVSRFNRALVEWLLWYNTERPHHSLGRLPPLRYLLDTFVTNPNQSKMCWTDTSA